MAKPSTFNPTAPGVYDVQGAADFVKLTKAYMHNLRHHSKGPKFEKHAGRIYYQEADLRVWDAERLARKAKRKSGEPKPAKKSQKATAQHAAA